MSESVETLAEKFHETYERLAPSFGYKTRWQTRRPWAAVPDDNKRLMVAVVSEVCGPLLAHLAEAEKGEQLFRELHQAAMEHRDRAEADRDEWKARAEILEGWHETALACQEALVKVEADRDRYKAVAEAAKALDREWDMRASTDWTGVAVQRLHDALCALDAEEQP